MVDGDVDGDQDRDRDAHGDRVRDDPRDAAADGDDAAGPAGWASWLLVAACVAPPLLLAEAARRVLGGDQDDDYFGWYAATSFEDTGASPADDAPLGDRFRVLWAVLELPGPLWAPVAGALLLTVVVLTGRPAALVPGRWGRRAGAVASWLSAAGSLAALLGLLTAYSAPEQDRRGRLPAIFGGGLPDDAPALAAAVAVLVPAVLVPALAGAALWREGPVTAAAAAPESPETPETPEEPPVQPPVQPAVQAPPVPAPPDEDVPVVADADRHLYRRPG